MKRKLISVMLSVFAMLLLMGAADSESAAALLAEEESAVSTGAALETEANQLTVPSSADVGPNLANGVPAADGVGAGSGSTLPPVPERPDFFQVPSADSIGAADPSDTAPGNSVVPAGDAIGGGTPVVPAGEDYGLLINGRPAPAELNRELQNGVTYVSLSVMARQLAPAAQVSWDGSAATVTTDRLSLTARVGQLYVEANGRYLYVPETVQLTQAGQVIVPLRVVAKAFDASVGYDAATGQTTVTSGSGAIQSGDGFYNQDDLFWLSRVIHKESGNQPMEGRMAVGNVVLNRVADPVFPDTVEGVLAQKNQFSTYKSGVLAATEPSETSTIAAKLVLDGGVVEETKGALYFDSGANSWAARNKDLIATIGGHKFYG